MSDPTAYRSSGAPDLSFEATLRGLKSGQKVFNNRYTLLRILGRGGMGVVWLARDDELTKDIALKFLPEYVALDKSAMEDLKEETKKTLDLTHPHIVRTFTFLADAEAEMAAIAMEHVDGLNLSDLRMDQESRVFEVVDAQFQRWVGQLCGALAYAHARKRIVHRDLKPSNLMINSEGELKVSDFGIARSLTESRTRLSRQSGASGGTLPYMSPQQAIGDRATESDDIYSLGATLYELLTGKPPFYSGEIFEQIKTKAPTPITERRAELNVQSQQPVPDVWERAVLACLAKKPEDRPASVAALARLLNLHGDFPESASNVAKPSGVRGLDRAPAHPKSSSKPLALLIPALISVALIAAGLWWFTLEKPKRDQAQALITEARAALIKSDPAAASQKLTQALSLIPTQPDALALRHQMEQDIQANIEHALGRADSALARKDLLAAREAYAEVLALRADHPRASAGFAGLKDIVGGIEVRTSPAGAKVQVGGQKEDTSPASIGQLPLGKHTVLIKLDGFDPVTEEITLRNDSFVPLDQKLVRQRGTMQLDSTPPGMAFAVRMTKSVISSEDEQSFTKEGKTPAVLENLPTGVYEARLSRAGWPDALHTVSINAGASEVVYHEFAEGMLSVESEPSESDFEIQPANSNAPNTGPRSFASSGQTPASVARVPVGLCKVVFKRAGWQDAVEEVWVTKDRPATVRHEFGKGFVKISSSPAGCEIYREGTKLGDAPLTMELPEGPCLLEARYPRLDSKAFSVTVMKRETVEQTVELDHSMLTIDTEPTGGTIFWGNVSLGKAPVSAILPTGNHTFTAQKTGYLDGSVTKLTFGGTSRLSIALKRSPFDEESWVRKFLGKWECQDVGTLEGTPCRVVSKCTLTLTANESDGRLEYSVTASQSGPNAVGKTWQSSGQARGSIPMVKSETNGIYYLNAVSPMIQTTTTGNFGVLGFEDDSVACDKFHLLLQKNADYPELSFSSTNPDVLVAISPVYSGWKKIR